MNMQTATAALETMEQMELCSTEPSESGEIPQGELSAEERKELKGGKGERGSSTEEATKTALRVVEGFEERVAARCTQLKQMVREDRRMGFRAVRDTVYELVGRDGADKEFENEHKNYWVPEAWLEKLPRLMRNAGRVPEGGEI